MSNEPDEGFGDKDPDDAVDEEADAGADDNGE